jgi:hypothetical protein
VCIKRLFYRQRRDFLYNNLHRTKASVTAAAVKEITRLKEMEEEENNWLKKQR